MDTGGQPPGASPVDAAFGLSGNATPAQVTVEKLVDRAVSACTWKTQVHASCIQNMYLHILTLNKYICTYVRKWLHAGVQTYRRP